MKNKKEMKVNDQTKKLVVALTEKIKEQGKVQFGDCFEKDGELFKTKVKFNGKSMNKYQYSELFALYVFMNENPNLQEADKRKVLNSTSI